MCELRTWDEIIIYNTITSEIMRMYRPIRIGRVVSGREQFEKGRKRKSCKTREIKNSFKKLGRCWITLEVFPIIFQLIRNSLLAKMKKWYPYNYCPRRVLAQRPQPEEAPLDCPRVYIQG